MNRLSGSIEVRLNVDDVAKINALIERDESKQATVTKSEHDGKPIEILKCPVCKNILYTFDAFCGRCGQRIDQDNVAL